jgi:acyl-CoA reductase-like NAD-dependent aldehyde dehydrogenase
VMRFAAPALAAGNGIVLKHANNVPRCALEIERVLLQAGVPQGLFATVLVDNTRVKGLIEDPRIAALTLTGSTPVGKLVASQAGAVLKKQVLELGGSDPFIVLADADLDAAARTAVKARFINVGQSCINGKRFIVEASVADAFSDLFVQHAQALKVGNPLERDVSIGPMARANLRADLHAQVLETVRQGAQLRLGGQVVDGPGFFYTPTVLDHVLPGMVAAREETFGPAAAILRVAGVEEAIELANSLDYGLGAALWTTDLPRAAALARRIEAGAVFINGLVASDPRLPFGGIKQSGYGRELGAHGAREFTNIKTVWMA